MLQTHMHAGMRVRHCIHTRTCVSSDEILEHQWISAGHFSVQSCTCVMAVLFLQCDVSVFMLCAVCSPVRGCVRVVCAAL